MWHQMHWHAMGCCMQLYLDRNVGSMQQEVCRCLMRLGINFDLENTIGGVLAVDIVLRMPDHPKLAVKVGCEIDNGLLAQ